jgi:hypothetical protein
MATWVAFYVRVSTGPAPRKAVNVPALFATIRRLATLRRLEKQVRELERPLRRETREVEILKVALDLARAKKPNCSRPGRGRISGEDRRHHRRHLGSLTSAEAGLISANSERPRWRNW